MFNNTNIIIVVNVFDAVVAIDSVNVQLGLLLLLPKWLSNAYRVSLHEEQNNAKQINDEQDEQWLIFWWLAEREFAHFCYRCVGFLNWSTSNLFHAEQSYQQPQQQHSHMMIWYLIYFIFENRAISIDIWYISCSRCRWKQQNRFLVEDKTAI